MRVRADLRPHTTDLLPHTHFNWVKQSPTFCFVFHFQTSKSHLSSFIISPLTFLLLMRSHLLRFHTSSHPLNTPLHPLLRCFPREISHLKQHFKQVPAPTRTCATQHKCLCQDVYLGGRFHPQQDRRREPTGRVNYLPSRLRTV